MWPYSIVGIEIRNDTVGKRPRFEDEEGSGTKERVVVMYQSVACLPATCLRFSLCSYLFPDRSATGGRVSAFRPNEVSGPDDGENSESFSGRLACLSEKVTRKLRRG